MQFGTGTARGRVQQAVARRLSWTLRMAGKDVLVVRRGSLREGEGILPVPHAQLMRWLADLRNRSALLTLYASVTGQPATMGGSLDQGPVLDQVTAAVAEAFHRGWLLVVGTPPGWSVIGNPAAKKAADAETSASSSSPKTKKTWIEIRLINKKGAPVPGAKYRLKLTDGSTEEGTTDEFGSARVTGIDPGMCEVSFLEFDAKEWKKA